MKINVITIMGVLAAILMIFGTPSMAATMDHKVVIEVVSNDPKQWEKLMNNIENLRVALGDKTSVEVVAHGEGLKLLVKSDEPFVARMKKASVSGVKFAACENTMKKQNIAKAQLLDFSMTVDSGVAEIIRKQEDHWAYIKN